jgi:hypothetical protein
MRDIIRLVYEYYDISFIYLLQGYQDFWSYLYKVYKIDLYDEFTELGVIDKVREYHT